VSCNKISIEEFAKIIPVTPPTVNIIKNPMVHSKGASKIEIEDIRVDIHLKILIPVGMAITIVAAVK
jgi:hypothetical protein